jgi:predicted ribosome quality control (RQC) complex YloA/Tae2 family protein
VLSLEELRRAGRWLDAHLRGHRVQGIAQIDATSVVFTTYGRGPDDESGIRRHLIFACGPDAARVGLLERVPAAPQTPPSFCLSLRSNLLNASIIGFAPVGEERQLAMRLRTREGEFDLLLAIFGRRSNVLLLDASGCIVASLRPLRETRPELSIGGEWRNPESRPPGVGIDRFADVPDDEFLRAVEAAYCAAHEQSEQDALARELQRVLRKEIKSYERKISKIEETLAEAEKATGLERAGELLKAQLSNVRRGDAQVVARDFVTGEEVVIALDPKLSPSENLARIFKRYQKAVRSLVKAGTQQEEMQAAKRKLDDLEAERASLRDAATIAVFSAQPEIARLLRKYARKVPAGPARKPGSSKVLKVGKSVVPQRLMPRRYLTAGGLEVWVGRSDEGNDLLTTRLAAGNDLFFHLDGAPGSHVILRTGGRNDPPSEAVLDACELAVHYSKAKNATRADIHIVPIKNVKKPKGAKRGLVMVHGGRTFHLRRMRTRLERVLAARIEEG